MNLLLAGFSFGGLLMGDFEQLAIVFWNCLWVDKAVMDGDEVVIGGFLQFPSLGKILTSMETHRIL